MHPSLWLLFRLRLKAAFRRFFRNIKSFRKGVVYLFVLLWFSMILFPNILFIGEENTIFSIDVLEIFLPFFILLNALLMVVFSAGERYINFPKSEIDFLFPAPLKRWHLLIYRIIDSVKGNLFAGLIFSVVALRYPVNSLCVFIGMFLLFFCIQLICILFVLVRQTVSMKPSRLRIMGVVVGLVVGLSIAFSASLETIPGLPTLEQVQTWFDSIWVKILLAPILPFSNLILSQNLFPEAAIWLLSCMMITSVLLFAIIKLDAHFMELSIIVNKKIYEQKQAIMRGGRATYKVSEKQAKQSSFRLPRLAGVGSIFAKQWLTAQRQLGIWFYVIPILSFIVGIGLGFLGPFSFGVMIYLLFLFTNWLRFDFRGDIDQLPWLKQLPIGALAMSLGQISVPVIWSSIVELCAGLGILITTGERLELLILLPCAIPLSLLLFGLHNFIFLLIPTRMISHNPGDMQHFGRNMMVFFLLTIMFAFALSVAIVLGMIMYYLSGENEIMMLTTITVTLFVISLMILPLLAWSYNRFDVGQDLPA